MDAKKKSKQHIFDSYCKTILRNEARNYYNHLRTKRQHEISFSDLSEEQLEQIAIMPNHLSIPLVSKLLGLDIMIDDLDIAQALMKLSEDKREIILLYYFLDMNDREIGNQLQAIQQTIHYRRKNILRELRRILEEQQDE